MRQRLWFWFYHRLVGLLYWVRRYLPDHVAALSGAALDREYLYVETLARGEYRYQIFFEGWCPAQDTTRLVGVWKAWPVEPRPHPPDKVVEFPSGYGWGGLPYIVVGVGVRAYGQYTPGANFDIRDTRGVQPRITREAFCSPDLALQIRQMWRESREEIRQLAHQAIAHRIDESLPYVPYHGHALERVDFDRETGEFVQPVGKWTRAA